MGGKMWEYVFLVGVFVIAIYAVFRAETEGTRIDGNFNERISGLEKALHANADSIDKIKDIVRKFDELAANQQKTNENIDKLFGILTNNLEGIHRDVERIDEDIDKLHQKKIDFPNKVKVVLDNSSPLMMQIMPEKKKTRSKTTITKTKTGYIKDSTSVSEQVPKLPGGVQAKKAMESSFK